MTTIINVNGLEVLDQQVYVSHEEHRAFKEGRQPPPSLFRPRLGNVAPRTDGWKQSRSNTQQPPLTGPGKDQRPVVVQPREKTFGPEPFPRP